MNDLFAASNPTNPIYLRLRDDQRFTMQKQLCKSLWCDFHDLADTEFIQNMAIQFHERFWEMYLGATLRSLRFQMTSADEGPDLQINTKKSPIWIEAVAPNDGSGLDKVYDVKNGSIGVPEDEILLRIRNAIWEKHDKKYKGYISKGTISADAPYVIAINGYDISHTEDDEYPTYIMRALFAIGNQYGVLNKETGEIVNQGYRHKTVITKRSGNPVSTDVFEDPAYSGISAIIYSTANALKGPVGLGDDFQLLFNPHAANPLPRNWLRVGTEIWAAEKTIESKTWKPRLFSALNPSHGTCRLLRTFADRLCRLYPQRF